MIWLTQTHLCAIVLGLIFTAIIGSIIGSKSVEHFNDAKSYEERSAADANVRVRETFQLLLDRNPTEEETQTYAGKGEIEKRIMEDYTTQTPTDGRTLKQVIVGLDEILKDLSRIQASLK